MASNTDVNLTKTLRCIVKLGGAAITYKNELERINEENLQTVCSQLRQAIIRSETVAGMDWSKRTGSSDICCNIGGLEDLLSGDSNKFIVVHGAGSFGHFHASKSGIRRGGLERPLVKAGLVATHISVGILNLEIVRALAREGIPSIGMPPFCGWSTSGRNIAAANLSVVAKTIESGLTPVLHGDTVLDDLQGCSLLSGDVIIRHLAEHMKPEYVVFLTDVFGVHDRPPTEPNAILLREIAVGEDGSWTVAKPTLHCMNKEVEITVAAHDTTGGMVTKISEAAMIAKLGIDVYIVKAATSHSQKALSGDLRDHIPDDWLGTVIRFSR